DTWLSMKWTRSSMWLAVIRMVTRQATEANAQATMPTRIRSARPFSSRNLLLTALISAPASAAELAADALERAVDVPEATEDVAGVALGRAQDAVGGVDAVQDVPAAELVGGVLDVLQLALNGRRPAEHRDEHVGRVDQAGGDLVLQDSRGVGHRSRRVDQRV